MQHCNLDIATLETSLRRQKDVSRGARRNHLGLVPLDCSDRFSIILPVGRTSWRLALAPAELADCGGMVRQNQCDRIPTRFVTKEGALCSSLLCLRLSCRTSFFFLSVACRTRRTFDDRRCSLAWEKEPY